MEDKTVGLTASELSQIWGNYMNASLYDCILTYFNEKVEDEEIGSLLGSALQLHQKQLATLTTIFENENHPVPQGFTDADVNPQAPRLYTDGYMLQNVLLLATLGMSAATMAISVSTREDIYSLYSTTHHDYNELHRQAVQVCLTKGIYIRPPFIPTPKEVDFVKKQTFLTGWLGERRPLLAPEISNLHLNIQHNVLGSVTLTGFSQVAESKEVRSYLQRGIAIAKKHVKVFSEILEGSDVPVPAGSDPMVTNSSEVSPFSDKLIMFLTTGMIGQGIAFYGFSITTNIRRDIASHYTRLMGEIALYSEDGANIMIENEWLEEPPRMVDRDELAKTTSRKE